MNPTRWHLLVNAAFLVLVGGVVGSALLSTTNLAKVVFTSSSRPMILSAPGEPLVLMAAGISLVLWIGGLRRRARSTLALIMVLAMIWVSVGYAVALDGVEGPVWSGPFPIALFRNTVWKPGDHETWIEARPCGATHLCLSVASGPETVVFAGPMTRQIARDLTR